MRLTSAADTRLRVCLLGLILRAVAAVEKDASKSQSQSQCNLYLAPSSTSTPDRIQLGVYAGRRYAKTDQIGIPEVAVQLLDVDAHAGRTGGQRDDNDKDEPNYFGVASQMLWTPDSTGAKYETDEHLGGPGRTFSTVPGIGMLGNFHPALINADWNENTTLFRTVMEDDVQMGTVHPSRGAVSTFYNVTVSATQDIPAGMELFLNFGQDWSDKALEKNPMATREDYEQADSSMEKVIDFFDRHAEELPDETKAEMYGFLMNDVVNLITPNKQRADILRSLMPESHTGLKEFKEKGGGSLRHKNPAAFRDVSWLEANGRCIDNLAPGPSTIPYAGKGAFATKTLEEGEVIIPVPLMHIGHRKELDMYDLVPKKEEEEDAVLVRKDGATAKPTSSQLLLNYCFGHQESNLLLFPFGSGFNYINHQSGDKANAKIVWSKESHGMHQSDWLELSPEELSDDKHKYVALMLDLVATKKIEEGDEIFIDYGDDWQEAWDEHVKQVEKADLKAGSWDPTALELNAIYHKYEPGVGYAKPYKTADELKDEPYPSERVRTACIMPDSWNGAGMRLCNITERIDIKDEDGSGEMNYNYTVKAQLEKGTQSDKVEYKTVRNLPHESVHFVDKPYSSDQSRPASEAPFPPFRHHISIPDDVMPAAWKKGAGVKAEEVVAGGASEN